MSLIGEDVITRTQRHLRDVQPIKHSRVHAICTFHIITYSHNNDNRVPSRLRLQLSTSDQLIVPSYNLTTVGRRAFPVSAENLWNILRATHRTSHLSTVAHGFPAASLDFLFRRSYLT